MLTLEQQVKTALEKSRHPLVVFRQNFSGDSLAAALATTLLCQQLGKSADIACAGFVLPGSYRFLPQKDQIKDRLPTLRQLVINVPAAKTKTDEFHYDVVGDELRLYLSEKAGGFTPEDIKAVQTPWKYDLIITLDTPDLESLGEIFSANRDFFYERPIINIDCSAANEQYGQINLVDINSGSTCGVLYNLIKNWDEKFFNPDLNTCLLTGIIDRTKSFKTGLINPQTLEMSSQLIARAARREEIVKHLYYSRDLGTLKLWGLTLARLKEYWGNKLVIASLTLADFQKTATGPENLPDIIDELISAVPGVELVVLLYQKPDNSIGAIGRSLGAFNLAAALAGFNPAVGQNLIKFQITVSDLAVAEEQVVAAIKQGYQPK
ncbi:MAG: DHH family phosphoesterase [Patescibacteria group bacterium]|jgi:nanoRNase/pAp phosphatase (c-di-AMP/oligoRNAs hydrolase)